MSEDKKVHSEDTRDILELVSNSSLIDFLTNEETCENVDENQLFSEINRLATLNINKYESEDEDRTIEELLKEAETLINQPICVEQEDQQQEVPNNITISCESTPLEIRNNLLDRYDYSTVMSATSQHDVSYSKKSFILLFSFLFYALTTALAITFMNAIISFPVGRISLDGSKNPCLPVSLISTVYEYLNFMVPFAQSSLPPAAGYLEKIFKLLRIGLS